MVRLLPLEEFRDCGIPPDDPLRWHYHRLLGRLFRRRVAIASAMLDAGRCVLELGYGSGTSFLELDARFRGVYGLDRHEYGGRIAAVFARHGIIVRLARGDVRRLPYADSRFDAVLALSVLEHLHPADQPAVMEEVRRVLRPAGRLVVGVPGVNGLMSAAFRAMGFRIAEFHFSTPAAIRAAAASALVVDRVRSQPRGAPAALMSYQWFRAVKR